MEKKIDSILGIKSEEEQVAVSKAPAPSSSSAEIDGTFTVYTSSFDTARVISQLVSFVGWFLVGISPVILLVSLVLAVNGGGFFLIGLLVSLVVAIMGILVVMSGQLTRAVVDTADNTGELLAVMKNKK